MGRNFSVAGEGVHPVPGCLIPTLPKRIPSHKNHSLTDHTKTEEDLARRITEGDEDAFAEVYHLYHDRLVRFCGNYVSTKQDAEDLAQDAILQFRRSIERFRVGEKIGPWIYRIARNKCLDFLKKKKPLLLEKRWSDTFSGHTVELHLEAMGPSPATSAERSDLRRVLGEVLDELKEEQRTVFLLKYVEELTRQEIAEMLDIPPATVKSRLYNTVRQIRANFSWD